MEIKTMYQQYRGEQNQVLFYLKVTIYQNSESNQYHSKIVIGAPILYIELHDQLNKTIKHFEKKIEQITNETLHNLEPLFIHTYLELAQHCLCNNLYIPAVLLNSDGSFNTDKWNYLTSLYSEEQKWLKLVSKILWYDPRMSEQIYLFLQNLFSYYSNVVKPDTSIKKFPFKPIVNTKRQLIFQFKSKQYNFHKIHSKDQSPKFKPECFELLLTPKGNIKATLKD